MGVLNIMTNIYQRSPGSPPVYPPMYKPNTYDVMVFTETGANGVHYYAMDSVGHIFCVDSPTSCIQEAINYLYNTKGSGKIYIKSGTYYINQNVVFPWHDGEDVIIEGEGMDWTIIQINAPNTVQSYSAATGQSIGAASWLNLFLRDLNIVVFGDYSSFTGGIFNMAQVWAKLDNVMLSGSYLKTQTPTSVFNFGGSAAPGKGAVWTNVYAGFQVGEVIGSSGGVFGINVGYEGFDWIGGGVSLNITSQSGRFVPLVLSGGANTRVRVISLPLYISPATVSSSLYAYIQAYASEIELVDVELPETSYTSAGCQVTTPSGSVVIVRRTIIHEGGSQIVPVVCNGFVYQEGMLLKQTVSVPVGTGGSYGSAVNVNVAYANIVGVTISVSNVASGETISVKLTMVFADGSTTSETLSLSSSTTYTLGLNDYMNLANTSGVPKKYLQVQASSNLSSTSASVTVQAVTQ